MTPIRRCARWMTQSMCLPCRRMDASTQPFHFAKFILNVRPHHKIQTTKLPVVLMVVGSFVAVPRSVWRTRRERIDMLSWSLTFLIVALLAAFLGFAGIAGTAAWIAKVLFLVFLVLFIISLVFGRRAM